MKRKTDSTIRIETRGPYSPGIVEGDYILTIVGNPFVQLQDRVLGPAEGPRLAFDIEPTRDEFNSGNVRFSPGLIEAIGSILDTHREALVIGKAGSGKTTLAYGYGFTHQVMGGPVLYLDCKDHLDSLDLGVMRHVVEVHKSPELLIIIDNVHLIPDRIEQLRRALRNLQAPIGDEPTSNSFAVLYLGRRVQDQGADRIRTYERMEAAGRVIHLHANGDAFQAVYIRFALRNKVSPPQFPETLLDRWVNDFAGDLVAFAVALQSLGVQLANPNISINPDVSLDSIRRRYLEPLSTNPDSYWNLLLLCIMMELELVADSEMFIRPTPVASPFPDLIEDGIVYVRSVGVDTKYELFHPSMGSLILRAAPKVRSRASILADGCFRRPNSIVHILMRLYDVGLFEEGRELESILRKPDFFSLCSANFKAQEWHKLFRILTRSGPDIFLHVEEELLKDKHLRGLIHQIIQSPPQFISSFVRYAEKKSPYLADAVKEVLLQEENQIALLENALGRPLADLALFLNYAKQDMPEVAQALGRRLSQEANVAYLLRKIIEADLHYVSYFLQYADTHMPSIALSLKNTLADEYRLHLVEKSLNTQPHLLVEFLKYIDDSMPKDVGLYLKGELAQEQYRERLVFQALSVGLGHLRLFFQYANRAMPRVGRALYEDLTDKHADRLSSRALETPIAELGVFLEYAHKNLPRIAETLDVRLASEEYRHQLIDHILAEKHLHLVGSFLRKTRDSAPRTFRVVVNGLSSVEHLNRLLMCASDTPLGNLKAFCSDMDVLAPELALVIKERLAAEEYSIRLRNRSLETPLDHLAGFLGYADAAMPSVSQSIKDWLGRENNRGNLIGRAMRTPPQNMRGFLNYAEWKLPGLVAAIRAARALKRTVRHDESNS